MREGKEEVGVDAEGTGGSEEEREAEEGAPEGTDEEEVAMEEDGEAKDDADEQTDGQAAAAGRGTRA